MSAAAQGVEGVYDNAAAPAVREPFSHSWFDFDPSFGFSLPGAYGGTDFSNRGEKGNRDLVQRTSSFLSYNAGLQMQFGPLGVTVLGDFLNYTVDSSESASSVALTLGRIHAVAAFALLDNQLVLGAGARIVFVNVREDATDGALVRMLGAAPQVGAVIKPNDVPWRLGITARAPVEASPLELGTTKRATVGGIDRAGPYILPTRITQPWELEFGAAWQLGPRPLNPAWTNPHDEERDLPDEERARPDYKKRLRAAREARYANWPREHVLLLASVVLTGSSNEAVALEGFIDQRRELVGRSISASPRFAVESEPLPNLVRGRAGVYFEPSRFEDSHHRQHFTFGTDVRLFSFDLFGLIDQTTWRISGFLDLAPRYQNFGFAIGPWH